VSGRYRAIPDLVASLALAYEATPAVVQQLLQLPAEVSGGHLVMDAEDFLAGIEQQFDRNAV